MNINFKKSEDGLVPAVIQDVNTLQVLMVGYMNQEAYQRTLDEKKVCFYSRSKNRLWIKGETSGNYLELDSIQIDCDSDALLVKAHPKGPACHLGTTSCFGERSVKGFIYHLEQIIKQRIDSEDEGSYTSKTFQKGINKMAQKLGEEAVELVIEAKDNNQNLFINEAADLMYHFILLLKAKNTSIHEVDSLLYKRHEEKTI